VSKQSFVTGRTIGLTSVIGIGAAFLLAGCGTSTAPPAGNSPSTGTSASHPASTSTPSSGGSSLAVPFPTAVGTTWVYRTTVGAVGGEIGKSIKKVVANTQVPAGQRVTIAETSEIVGSHTSSRGYFIVHPNGSISYPFNQLNTSSTVTSNSSILWPPAAAINAGTPYHATIVIHEKEGTQTDTVTAHVTVQGKGTASVTVPAGSYTATRIDVTMTEKVLGHTVSITVTSWDAPNVGIVKSQAVIHEAGINEVAATDVLESFTRG
jgi:hypothetical protein